jgi:hypothetical protein
MTIDLPALAKLTGVTPETHRLLFESKVGGYAHPEACFRSLIWILKAPGPDQPEAFDDWALTPLMRWMQEHDHNPSIVGLDFGHITKFTFAADCFSLESMKRTANVYDDCMTLALLHAARAAGVPEICKLFKETTDAQS